MSGLGDLILSTPTRSKFRNSDLGFRIPVSEYPPVGLVCGTKLLQGWQKKSLAHHFNPNPIPTPIQNPGIRIPPCRTCLRHEIIAGLAKKKSSPPLYPQPHKEVGA